MECPKKPNVSMFGVAAMNTTASIRNCLYKITEHHDVWFYISKLISRFYVFTDMKKTLIQHL